MGDNYSDSGVESSASASVSTTSIDQIQCRGDNTDRVRQLFYGQAADVHVEFPDGNTISFNKFPLAAKSRVFSSIFYNETTAIPDIRVVSLGESSESFKLFLDCLMGFEKCTKQNVNVILPIALKYEVVELLEKWMDLLKPEILNEEVCLSLNLAIKYNYRGLLIDLIEFLTDDGRINRIFDEVKYYNLLEPSSVCKLLDYVKIDSFVIEIIFKWAEYYLTKIGNPVDFKKLFTECKIVDKITLDCFETTSAIFNFNDSVLARNYFTAEEILSHIRKTGMNDRKSEWVRIEAGFEIEENFTLNNIVQLEGYSTLLVVHRNPVIFYNIPEDKKNMMSWHIAGNFSSGGLIFAQGELDFNSSDNNFVAVLRITDESPNPLALNIKWRFNYDCRVLRITPTFIDEKENMYYTKNISYLYAVEAKSVKVEQQGNGKKIILDISVTK